MNFFVAIVVYLFSLSIEFVMSSHFRGGTLCILPDQATNTILLKTKLSWQQSYNDSYRCNSTTIAASKETNVDGNFTFGGSCIGADFSTITLQCTDFSLIDDWMSGMYNTSLQCSSSNVEIWYTGIGWPEIQNGNSNWSLYLNASLEKRSDTGQINHSPITLMRPIIRILRDCNHTIPIPVADNDGDTLRCRWSTNNDADECGGACSMINGVSLDEESCSLYYTANSAQPGTYVVAIQVEDYMSSDSAFPMSSVPLQFIVEFVDMLVSCQYPNITDSLNSNTIDLAVGVIFNDTLIGTSGNDTQYIIAIEVTAPTGTNRSDLQRSQSNGSDEIWFVDVYWLPTSDQEGINLFCFIALNNLKLTSLQRCVKITATTSTSVVYVSSKSDAFDESLLAAIISGVISTLIASTVITFIAFICKKRKNQQKVKPGNNGNTSVPTSGVTSLVEIEHNPNPSYSNGVNTSPSIPPEKYPPIPLHYQQPPPSLPIPLKN